MSKKVLVPIAHGTEETEAVTIIDILRRAGADVTVAACGGQLGITASRGVELVADRQIEGCLNEKFDCIVLPGGARGAEHLRDDPTLTEMLLNQNKSGRYIGAICAAPAVILEFHEILDNHKATCHPDFAPKLENQEAIGQRVVIDGNIITGQGPGTALEFSLALVQLLYGEKKANDIAKAVVV
ncbi:MAG: DJ-1 family protein [Chitinivibrionales bacterium]|nr:DJ-1 family protein [Chitinivibrionales bacterium]